MSEPTPLKPAYIICGSDQPKVRRAAAQLQRRVYDETSSDLNIDPFDGRGDSVAAVLEAADTPTFTLGTRLLLVTAADKWASADRDRVAAWVGDPVPGVCIALVGDSFRKTERLYKLLEKAKAVLRYDLPKKHALPEWVAQRARAHRAHLAPTEAKQLLALVGEDPDTLEREIEKLAAYAGGAPITRADIDEVCCPTVEARIFELTDAVGRRDAAAVFRLLESLYASGGRSTGEVARSTLYSLVKYVGQLRAAAELPSEMPPPEAAQALGVKPYTATKLLEQRRRFDARALETALAVLADAQADMVGTSPIEPEFSLEMAVARLLGRV